MHKLRPIFMIALGGMLVTGCVSSQQARANGPARTYTTASTPEQVRDCLIASSHVNTATPFGNGWQVSNLQNPNIAQIAEIERVEEKTSVKVYTGAMAKTLIYQVERCV